MSRTRFHSGPISVNAPSPRGRANRPSAPGPGCLGSREARREDQDTHGDYDASEQGGIAASSASALERGQPAGPAEPRLVYRNRPLGAAALAAMLSVAPAVARGGDWSSWRGPEQNGVSRETGFPDTFTREGENVVWKR